MPQCTAKVSDGSIATFRPWAGDFRFTQSTDIARPARLVRCQKLPSANCYIPFSSCAYLPIQFASLIHGLIERAASECFAKAIFASNIYERLGRQALAAGEP